MSIMSKNSPIWLLVLLRIRAIRWQHETRSWRILFDTVIYLVATASRTKSYAEKSKFSVFQHHCCYSTVSFILFSKDEA